MITRIFEDMANLYPLWRDTCLGYNQSEKKEADFVKSVFGQYGDKIKTVIDLGGGVGLHTAHLLSWGYDVTLFDQSKTALAIAKNGNPALKIEQGSFETIDITKNYDAAICMWSTLSYVLDEKGRAHFYEWIRNHINKVVILDEANYFRYSSNFHKTYEGENEKYKLKIDRDWSMDNDRTKTTKYVYEISNKENGKVELIDDGEIEHYLSPEELSDYMGKEFSLKHLLGGYQLSEALEKAKSLRIITVFEKQ